MSEESTWVGSDGVFGDVSTAPASVKSLVESKGIKSVEALADSYVNAASKLGVNPDSLVTWPGEGEDMGPIHKRLGRPDTAAEYSLDFKSDILSEELVKGFKDHAHKLGLSGKQFNETVKFQVDAVTSAMEIQTKETEDAEREATKVHTETVEKLKVKHGIKTDEEYAEVIKTAGDFAKKIGMFEYFEKQGLANDFVLNDKLIEFSKRVSIDDLIPSLVTNGKPADKDRITEITKDPAFTDRMHPKHKDIMKEYNALHGLGKTG